ncbi:MAG: hypothetical protein HON65_07855 [Rhodospirillales bacterium]|nr:hypothetical protein [Rhodospirillales bacterium]
MIRNAILPFLIIFLAATPASSSGVVRNNATNDGIGYRSNLIDPLNPYATSRKLMLWSLLERYGLVPGYPEVSSHQRTYIKNLGGSDYIARVRELLSSENKALGVAKYHYAYGICETNDYPSGLAFMEAAVQELRSTPETDRLIVARHHLLKLCNTEKSDLHSFLDGFNTILQPLRDNEAYASWAAYLDGVIYFYEELFESAKAKFASIEGDRYGWLKDTADYMEVRISKAKIDSFRVPTLAFHQNPKRYLEIEKPTVVPKLELALSNLQQAMRLYLNSHPKGRYVEIVRDLRRYVFWLNGDRNALVTATHQDFARIISSRTPVAIQQKISFLNEAMGSTEAIFEVPKKDSNNFSMHPLAVVAGLLVEIANEGNLQEKSSSQFWHDLYNYSIELNSSIPGLSNYFELLLLAHSQKYQDIVQHQINREAFGPLFVDALILQARALGKIGRHLDAAKMWLSTSQEFPLNNALTEVATAHVRAGTFIEFARIEKTWMTDFDPGNVTKDEWLSDELNIDVKTFYATHQPYRNLLRRGFETLVSSDEADSVYSDASINPIIRFLAAEPVLRTSLLNKNYSAFISKTKRVFDTKFDANWSKRDGGTEAVLVEAYRSIIPKVRAIISDPNDPDALTAIGYFLYSQNRFPKCFEGKTLWETLLNKCNDEQIVFKPGNYAVPINLFSRALSIYKSQPMRTHGEAKVLRILIFCFKGYENPYNCVRGMDKAYPKSIRIGYFQRLHKFFPKAAKQTPYWY